jgi:hypothetical protein
VPNALEGEDKVRYPMDMHTLKQRLQNHFTDGLVTIIGCGLSSAEGLPGMAELAQYLRSEIPKCLDGSDSAVWDEIVAFLDQGINIEQAMIKRPPTVRLEGHIVKATSEFLLQAQTKVIDEVLKEERILRLTRLLPHMLKTTSGIPVITTNYDLLIEIASEMAGFGVDTLFVGHYFGVLNEKESRMSFCRSAVLKKHSYVILKYANKVLLLKPHGSLDWFLCSDDPIRCPININQPRLIITPGLNKFRTGYDRPFDSHRDKANECIDYATRFLIIGYGFNDDHLQTHLIPKLKEGSVGLVLVKTLSENARKLINECDGMFALTAPDDPSKKGVCYIDKQVEMFLPGADLWDLGVFVQEVLEP